MNDQKTFENIDNRFSGKIDISSIVLYVFICIIAYFLGRLIFTTPSFFSFGIVFFLSIFVITWIKPYIGLLFVIALPFLSDIVKYFQGETISPLYVSPTKIFGFFVLVSWVLKGFLTKTIKIIPAKQTVILLLIFIVMFISTVVNRLTNFMYVFVTYIVGCVTYFLTYHILKSKEEFVRLLWTLILVGLASIMATGILPTFFSSSARIRGALSYVAGNTNSLAFYLNTILPFIFYLATIEKVKIRFYIYSLIMFIIAFSILATVSRGGITTLCILLLLLIMRYPRKGAIFLSVFLISFSVLLPFTPRFQGILPRFVGAGHGERLSTENRLDNLKAGIKLVKDNPVWGVGPANFRNAVMPYKQVMLSGAAHNAYMQAFGELGIAGGVLFLILIWHCLGDLAKSRRICMKVKNTEMLALVDAVSISYIGVIWGTLFLNVFYSKILFVEYALIVLLKKICLKLET